MSYTPQLEITLAKGTKKIGEKPNRDGSVEPVYGDMTLEDFLSKCYTAADFIIDLIKPKSELHDIHIERHTMCPLTEFAESICLGPEICSAEPATFHDEDIRLREITVSPDNRYLTAVDGVLFSKDMKTLLLYPPAKPDITYTIPDGVTSIGRDAFSYARNLFAVKFPDSVKELGSRAFKRAGIRNITLPDKVTSIPSACFADCLFLESITVGPKFLQIGNYAFNRDRSLHFFKHRDADGNVHNCFPPKLNKIGKAAFAFCHGFANLDFGKSTPQLLGDAFVNIGATSVVIPAGVAQIPEGCFYQSELSTVYIPSTVQTIDSKAFWFCKNLKNVVFAPGSVLTKVGCHAFRECTLLKEFCTDGIFPLEGGAFYGCTSLERFICGNPAEHNVIRIEDKAFSECYSLKEVRFTHSQHEDYPFVDPLEDGDIVLSLGQEAFANCNSLEHISVGRTSSETPAIKTAGSSVFENCGIRNINLTKSALINRRSFRKCNAKIFAHCGHKGLELGKDAEWVVIPNGAF